MKEKELCDLLWEEYAIKLFDLSDNSCINWVFDRVSNGMKVRMIIRHNDNKEIRFKIYAEKLNIGFDSRRIRFYRSKDKKTVFSISSPYLEDAGGLISNDIYYEIVSSEQYSAIVTIKPNSTWYGRVCTPPVTICYQIKIDELTDISTYSNIGGKLAETVHHKIGWDGINESEMLLSLKRPILDETDTIEYAELRLTHESVFSADRNIYNISLIQIGSLLSNESGRLVDSVPLHYSWSLGNGGNPTYVFNITELLKENSKKGITEMFFKIKMEIKKNGYENYVVMHGATASDHLTPEIRIDIRKETNKSNIKKGDLVALKNGSCYVTGAAVPKWFQMQKWFVADINDEGVLLRYNELGSQFEMPRIYAKDITFVARDSFLWLYLEGWK